MITTTTDVCNLALARLGARRLTDFDDDTTTEAKACRLQFDIIRDSLLRRHQWDFATASVMLEEGADPPISEYAKAWDMPADCVRIIRLSSGDSAKPIQDFARRGRSILTQDYTEIELVYVTNGTEIETWDSLFIQAVMLSLAKAIAGDVTQNPALAQECQQELEALALPAAQTADAREASSGEGFNLENLVAQSTLGRMRRFVGVNYGPIADI